MARLYSNVNDRFRHSNLGRVTYQQLELIPKPDDGSKEVKLTLDEMDALGQNHYLKSLMRALHRIRPLMEARPDKRFRPIEVPSWLFVEYRKKKIGFRKRTIVKKKKRPA